MFDKEYFIKKFQAIPEDQWREDGNYGNEGECRCAIGHCGVDSQGIETEESTALHGLFGSVAIIEINDGELRLGYPGTTPKQRILAALRDL